MRKISSPRGRISPKSVRYRLRIRRSRIHRLGVFTLDDIPVGHQVIEFTGRRLRINQPAKLKPYRADYAVVFNQGRAIDGYVGGSGAEFINYSCSPNLTDQCRQGRLFFYSRRRIRAGEELTRYYAHPIKARRIPCDCGERKCRKTLRYVVE